MKIMSTENNSELLFKKLIIIAILFLLRFIWTFNKFDDIFLLTGGNAGTRTLTVNVYEQAFAVSNLGAGAAVGTGDATDGQGSGNGAGAGAGAWAGAYARAWAGAAAAVGAVGAPAADAASLANPSRNQCSTSGLSSNARNRQLSEEAVVS